MNILDKIVFDKRREVEIKKSTLPIDFLMNSPLFRNTKSPIKKPGGQPDHNPQRPGNT